MLKREVLCAIGRIAVFPAGAATSASYYALDGLSQLFLGRGIHSTASELMPESSGSSGRKQGGKVAMAKSWDAWLEKRSKNSDGEDEQEVFSFLDSGKKAKPKTKRREKKETLEDDMWETGSERRKGRVLDRPRQTQEVPERGPDRHRNDYVGQPRMESRGKNPTILPFVKKTSSRDFILHQRAYLRNDMGEGKKEQDQIQRDKLSFYSELDEKGWRKGPKGGNLDSAHGVDPQSQGQQNWKEHLTSMRESLSHCQDAKELRLFLERQLPSLFGSKSSIMSGFAAKRLSEMNRPDPRELALVLDLIVPRIKDGIEHHMKAKEITGLPSLNDEGLKPEGRDSAALAFILFLLAKMNQHGQYTHDFIRYLLKDDFSIVRSLSARSLPQVMWAVAKARVASPLPMDIERDLRGLNQAFMESCLKFLHQGQAHPLFLSNTTWSLGKLGVGGYRKPGDTSDQLMKELGDRARADIANQLSSFLPTSSTTKGPGTSLRFDAVSLATFCHGLSRMNHYDGALMQMAGNLMLDFYERQGLDDLRPISNFLYACSSLLHCDDLLLERLASFVSQALKSDKARYPVSINHITWSYAVLKHSNPELMDSVIDWTIKNLRQFSMRDQNLSLICWSLMTLGHEGESSRRLIDLTSDYVLNDISRIDPIECSNLFQHTINYAQSILILSPDRIDLLAKFVEVASSQLIKLKDQGIIDQILAEVKKQTGFLKSSSPSESHSKEEDIQLGSDTPTVNQDPSPGNAVSVAKFQGHFIACRSLWSIHMELVDRGHADSGLKGWQLDACKEMWLSALELGLSSSAYQEGIFSSISAISTVKPKSEVRTDDKFFSLDVCIDPHPKWGKVAIEVDGPFHFFSNHPGVFHGKAKLRNRFLSRRVDKLLSINLALEWKHLNTEMSKRKFLLQLLGQEK